MYEKTAQKQRPIRALSPILIPPTNNAIPSLPTWPRRQVRDVGRYCRRPDVEDGRNRPCHDCVAVIVVAAVAAIVTVVTVVVAPVVPIVTSIVAIVPIAWRLRVGGRLSERRREARRSKWPTGRTAPSGSATSRSTTEAARGACYRARRCWVVVVVIVIVVRGGVGCTALNSGDAGRVEALREPLAVGIAPGARLAGRRAIPCLAAA